MCRRGSSSVSREGYKAKVTGSIPASIVPVSIENLFYSRSLKIVLYNYYTRSIIISCIMIMNIVIYYNNYYLYSYSHVIHSKNENGARIA